MSTSKDTEKRVVGCEIAEVRVVETGDQKRIQGLAIPYERWSEILGGYYPFKERISRGAFEGAVNSNPDVRFLVNHDANRILGRTRAKTLILSHGDDGVRFDLDVADTQAGRDAIVLVRRGDITGMSFRMYVVTDEWAVHEKMDARTIKEATFDDITLATYPAYPDTEAAVRSLEAARAQRGTPKLDRANRRMRMALADGR